MNIFEQASRLQIRFPSPKGLLTTEDLWRLPLTSTKGRANLDDIARSLNTKVNGESAISFVKDTSTADAETKVAFEIVKHVIDTRLQENKAKRQAEEMATKKKALLEAIVEAENKELTTGTLDELRARLAAM